jgi:hypothetical protein
MMTARSHFSLAWTRQFGEPCNTGGALLHSLGHSRLVLLLGTLALLGCGERTNERAGSGGTSGSGANGGATVGGGGASSGSGGIGAAGRSDQGGVGPGGSSSAANAGHAGSAGAAPVGGAGGNGGRPSVGGSPPEAGAGGVPPGGSSSGDSGTTGLAGEGSAGGAGEGTGTWSDGEFRVCVTETAYTRARVYGFDPETSSCVTLLLEAPSDACRPGFLVNGPWCLANGTLAVGVNDCEQNAAAQAGSITGTFSVSSEGSLTADVFLHFDDGGAVPAELAVNVSACRLVGCSSDDCRE